MKKIILIIFIPTILSAQGVLFDRGVHSVKGEVMSIFDEGGSAFGLDIVASYSGLFDFGFTYSKSSSDYSESTSYVPNISFNLRKEDNPGGIRLSLGYLSSKTTITNVVSNKDRTLEITGYLLGASVYVQLFKEAKTIILPHIGASYGLISGDYEDPLSVDMGLLLKHEIGCFGLILEPLVSVDIRHDIISYGLGFGSFFNF